MTKIGSKVAQLRTAQGLSQKQLAELANVDATALSRFERGQRGMPADKLMRVSAALRVSVDSLYASRSNVAEASIGSWRVPLLDYVQAGKWTEVRQSIADGDFQDYVLSDIEYPPSVFALRIRGDSMEPLFVEGDRVIVDTVQQPQPGDFVVATDENGEATFKKFRPLSTDERGRQRFELVALNENYGPMRSDLQHIAIVGVMIEHRRYRRR